MKSKSAMRRRGLFLGGSSLSALLLALTIPAAVALTPTSARADDECGVQAADGAPPKKLLERLKSAGRLEQLKEDLAQRKALDVIAESAKPVAAEPTQASS